MTNPLLSRWDTPFELPPFASITDDDFAPAFKVAIDEARANIVVIAGNADAPTFGNTIEALEQADEALGRVLSVFYNLAGADSTSAREELQREFSPKLAAYSSEISMNEALFGRVETLWGKRDELGLTDEQARVLMLTRRSFVRAGAQLQGASRDRLKDVLERLAVLGTEFSQNLLADEREWFMELGADDLAGLPDFVLDAARAAGQEKGVDGPVVTLSRSLITPFLQFSARRDLRAKAYDAFVARGANGGNTDNRAIAAETLALREERAHLLDYENFAAFKLETEMAKTPDAVRGLLMDVWQPAKEAANADAEIL
ncbi:MAG: peptidase M3, partial [Marinosulfonomonas sp.]|nr:peptidase M3 [Marinosulfonomonas sp.]